MCYKNVLNSGEKLHLLKIAINKEVQNSNN
jgi:hypothetical protein